MPRQYTHRGNATKLFRAEYNAWFNMNDRCHNPNHPDFVRYGGRGIAVCDRWRSYENGFENFLSDVGPRPAPRLSLDRINNEEGYEPLNCAWRNLIEQASNKHCTPMVTLNGRNVPLMVACREYGITPRKVRGKIRHRGITLTEAFIVCIHESMISPKGAVNP
jgi:hypothetical protein